MPGRFTVGQREQDEDEDEESFIDKAIQRVIQDPNTQVRLAAQLQEAGIPPSAIAAIADEDPEVIKQRLEKAQEMQKQQKAQQKAQQEPMSESTTQDPAVTPDDLAEFIQEVAGIHPKGEDATLGDIRQFVEDNPDIAQNAIDLYL